MDWMTTGGIILGIFGVTAILSLLIPRDGDPEVGRDNGDGPVIPVPGADGSVTVAGKKTPDDDYDPATGDGDGDADVLN